MADKGTGGEAVYVAVIDQTDSYVVTHLHDRWRMVLPVELCNHDHSNLEEAIKCGYPRAFMLASMLGQIAEDLDKHMRSQNNGHNDPE